MQTRNAFRNVMKHWTPEMDDRLCALVETDQYSFGQIAVLMNMTRHQITSRFTKIRRNFGRQGT